MAPSVFVSYARENIAQVRQLVAELAAEGVNAWFDEGIEPAELWAHTVANRIREREFFILCLSRELLRRENSYVYEELAVARAHKGLPTSSNEWLILLSFDSCPIPDRQLAESFPLSSVHVTALSPDTKAWKRGVDGILRKILPKFTIRPEMILVPPPSSLSNSPSGSSFLIGKYPVTQGEWEHVMGHNPSRFRGDWNRPVENISWKNAQKFIETLNDGGTLHYRLPTEKEWIFACLAGSTGEFGFSGPDSSLSEYAWFSTSEEERRTETLPVGERKPNAWGLHDMHGNVCEWVSDTKTVKRSGTSSGVKAKSKGGSYDGFEDHCRASSSTTLDVISRYDNLGFRLAADVGDLT